jgi:pimeloyl-ACP methyl ester carboxylesterase
MRYAIVALVYAVLIPSMHAVEKNFDSEGMKIAYLDEGHGEVVVLLHGFSGSTPERWTKVPFTQTQFLPALKGYRVLAPDHRGHGKSDKPYLPEKYGAELAADVVRLLDHVKVKKAHVVGYSMGAMVAGKLLVSHPDRLLSVTFGGGGPLFNQPKVFTEVIDATVESLEKGEGMGCLIIALIPEGQPKPTLEQAAAFSAAHLKGKDQMALAAVLRGFPRMTVTEAELKANKVPLQFVYGDREVGFIKDIVAASNNVLKANEVVVKNGDHGSTLITPEFRKAVQDFLKENGSK